MIVETTPMAIDPGIPDFMLRAGLAGAGVAIVAGPLGAFVVWRRMAYFGEALAHSSLLGVVLGIVLGILPWVAVLGVSMTVAVLLYAMDQSKRATLDAAIGIIAHGALATGLVLLAFVETARVDLFAYLFGDVLAVTWHDLWLIYGGGAVIMGVLAHFWHAMLSVVVSEEVASVEGVNIPQTKLVYLLMLAVVVAAAMKIVGVVLIVALLIAPASTARQIAHSPEQMAVLASLAGVLSVIGGLWGSYQFDTPAGPSIVMAAIGLFVVALCFGNRPVRRVP
jgi:zinc transport system permease protein